jgi:hypothetical protein
VALKIQPKCPRVVEVLARLISRVIINNQRAAWLSNEKPELRILGSCQRPRSTTNLKTENWTLGRFDFNVTAF